MLSAGGSRRGLRLDATRAAWRNQILGSQDIGNQLQDIKLLIQSRPLDRLADSHNLDATQILQGGTVQFGQESQRHAYRTIVIQSDHQALSGVVPYGGCERLTAPSLRTPPRGRRKLLFKFFFAQGKRHG